MAKPTVSKMQWRHFKSIFLYTPVKSNHTGGPSFVQSPHDKHYLEILQKYPIAYFFLLFFLFFTEITCTPFSRFRCFVERNLFSTLSAHKFESKCGNTCTRIKLFCPSNRLKIVEFMLNTSSPSNILVWLMSNFRNNSLCWSNNSHPSKWWFRAKCWFCSGRTQITLQFTRIQHTQRDIKTPQWIERIELEKWFATDFKQVLLQIEFIFVHTVCKFQIRTPFEESNVYTQIKHKRFHLNVDFLFFVVLSFKKVLPQNF